MSLAFHHLEPGRLRCIGQQATIDGMLPRASPMRLFDFVQRHGGVKGI